MQEEVKRVHALFQANFSMDNFFLDPLRVEMGLLPRYVILHRGFLTAVFNSDAFEEQRELSLAAFTRHSVLVCLAVIAICRVGNFLQGQQSISRRLVTVSIVSRVFWAVLRAQLILEWHKSSTLLHPMRTAESMLDYLESNVDSVQLYTGDETFNQEKHSFRRSEVEIRLGAILTRQMPSFIDYGSQRRVLMSRRKAILFMGMEETNVFLDMCEIKTIKMPFVGGYFGFLVR